MRVEKIVQKIRPSAAINNFHKVDILGPTEALNQQRSNVQKAEASSTRTNLALIFSHQASSSSYIAYREATTVTTLLYHATPMLGEAREFF